MRRGTRLLLARRSEAGESWHGRDSAPKPSQPAANLAVPLPATPFHCVGFFVQSHHLPKLCIIPACA